MSKEIQNHSLGVVGEAFVKLQLLRKGYEVYIGDDCTSVDMIALHPETRQILRVEVKTTRRRNTNDSGWFTDIRSSYSDANFDSEKVDVLAIYIEPLDRVLFIPSKTIKTKTSVLIKDSELHNSFDL